MYDIPVRKIETAEPCKFTYIDLNIYLYKEFLHIADLVKALENNPSSVGLTYVQGYVESYVHTAQRYGYDIPVYFNMLLKRINRIEEYVLKGEL